MTQDNDLRIAARTARLQADADVDSAGPWTFSGIAVAAGDVLHMEDGTEVLFTDEELAKAAGTQAGEPLTKDHPRDADGEPKYPPDVDETFGSVPKADYVSVDGKEGVGYEATTHDPAIARGVQAGSYEVSVHPTFNLGEKDEETGAYVAKNITFQDLSVVSKGDSPSNTADWGPSQALASWSEETDVSELLANTDSSEETDETTATLWNRLGRRLGITAGEQTEETVEAESSEDEADSEPDMGNEETPDDPEQENEQTPGDETPEEETDEQTLGDMTVSELGEALREQGFVTEDNATEIVDQATAQKEKAEKVDEIIANSSDFDEDDREDLMASADSIIDKTHKQATTATGARLPGNTGRRQATAGAQNDEDTLDAYGTGVGN